MDERQNALQSRIADLMHILDAIRTNGVISIVVQTDRNESRTYNIRGLYEALNELQADAVNADANTLTTLEGIYEHDKEDVARIAGKLAAMAATAPGDDRVIDVVAKPN